MNQAEQLRSTRAERFAQAGEHVVPHNSKAEQERKTAQEEAERKHREKTARTEAEQKSEEIRKHAVELIAEQNALAQFALEKERRLVQEKVQLALQAAAQK